jgi:hypothetical protein
MQFSPWSVFLPFRSEYPPEHSSLKVRDLTALDKKTVKCQLCLWGKKLREFLTLVPDEGEWWLYPPTVLPMRKDNPGPVGQEVWYRSCRESNLGRPASHFTDCYHCSLTVQIASLESFEHWDRGFESRMTVWVTLFCVVLTCVRSPTQGTLPKYLNGFILSEVISESEQARGI